MSKTYNSPGKARKQCPECNIYVHARNLECVCGYKFKKSNRQIKQPTYKDEPGHGRKQCSSCKKYIGAKLKKCLCGSSKFVKTLIRPTALQLKDEETQIKIETPGAMNYVGKLILIPSGQCPVELDEVDKESVYNWCDTVFNKGLRNNCTYTESALKYWARIGCNKPEAGNLIHEWAINHGYESQIKQESSEKNTENKFQSTTCSESENSALFVLNS